MCLYAYVSYFIIYNTTRRSIKHMKEKITMDQNNFELIKISDEEMNEFIWKAKTKQKNCLKIVYINNVVLCKIKTISNYFKTLIALTTTIFMLHSIMVLYIT